MSLRAAVVGLGLALLCGCLAPIDVGGNDAGHCGPSNCAGCCDAKNICRAGTTEISCGLAGASCSACAGGSTCQSGQCAGTGCVLPSSLDWAAVAIGDSAVRTIALKNSTTSAAIATIGPITGEAARFTSSDVAQTVSIPAGQTQDVDITFAPTEAKASMARVIMRVSDSCPDQVISLIGSGVPAVLTWSPDPLDCGYLTPGIERVTELTFDNPGARAVKLSNLRPSTNEFRLLTPQPITVPALGSTKVAIAAKPAVLGPRGATLAFDTDLPKQPAGVAQLKCYGGGPDIHIASPLDVGSIAYFAGASSYVTGKLTIQNVGTLPTPPDSRANLHLGSGGTGNVFWQVRAKAGVAGNTAVADEVCVGEFVGGACTNAPAVGSYDKAIGLEASAGKALLDVPVRVMPKSAGAKEWEVIVHSDDPDEPTFTVTVRADAVVLPPCDVELLPAALGFGLVASGSTRELEVSLHNKGADQCLLSGIAISAASHPAFTLVGGPIASQALAAGASKRVAIRFAPTGATPPVLTPVAGTLELFVSRPVNPQVTIPLTATLGVGCLTVVPNRVDFGTIQQSCNSATRTVLLYNTCAAALEVASATLTQATSEMIAVNTAGIAAGTMISPGSSPATFSLKYQPADQGRDTGAFTIQVLQGGEAVDYVIPLSGAGDMAGLNSDTLLTGGNLKADILLVLDNSCSMSDKQMSLGAGFPAFINYARSVGLDFQIAVTTSDMTAEAGRIIGSMTLPKILKSSTPGLNGLFSQKVQLGISGSSTEELLAPATAAVTAPLVSTDNAGFLRPGATLGIVSVSDAEDQSPQTVSFYVNQLLNVKPPGQLTFSAIAPLQATSPVSGCTYDGIGGSPRIVQAVAAMGGMVREICTPDWNQGLLDLGPSVFGSVFGASSFLLSNIPDLTGGKAILVKVNGVVVPAMAAGGGTVWTYDSTANRLIFEPSYTPGPGDAVTATYFVACIP